MLSHSDTDRDPNRRTRTAVYNGTNFRSRLEAKWAVFFEAYGLEYKYEFGKVEIDGMYFYRPDFFFPQIKMFGECKQVFDRQDEIKKCRILANVSRCGVLFLQGLPEMECYWGIPHATSDIVSKTEDLLVPYIFGDHEVYYSTRPANITDPLGTVITVTNNFSRMRIGVNAAIGARFQDGDVDPVVKGTEPIGVNFPIENIHLNLIYDE